MTDRNAIHKLIKEELTEANKIHPPFNSPHEAYAVILEEWEEMIYELVGVRDALDYMWESIKDDDEESVFDAVTKASDYMIDALREAIQVSAMLEKAK